MSDIGDISKGPMTLTGTLQKATTKDLISRVATLSPCQVQQPCSSLPMASLNLYTFSFNCGRTQVDPDAFSKVFLHGTKDILPDLVFLSLQEIAPIYASFIGGSFLVPYFSCIQDGVNRAAEKAGGSYKAIVVRHVGMTALMAFAKDVTKIESFETAGVGVGRIEMGNKGAVGLRLVYKEGSASTELTLVAMHLAAMESQIKRRNDDWMNIVRGLVFTSTSGARTGAATSLSGSIDDEQPLLSVSPDNAGLYKSTSHLFIAGDLNYRTSVLKPSPIDPQEAFPQPNHPISSPRHHLNFLENDQLNQERLAGRTCHGLTEHPVTFPPTYKYTDEEPFLILDENLDHWNWAEHRWPSWCDRILYLQTPEWLTRQAPTAKIDVSSYVAIPLMPTSDHRAVASSFIIPLLAIPSAGQEDDESQDPRINKPFNIDPDWKTRRERARRLEIIVGFAAYLTTSWEGAAVAIATIIGVVGGFLALKAILEF